jgi:uncharacterized membrane protein
LLYILSHHHGPDESRGGTDPMRKLLPALAAMALVAISAAPAAYGQVEGGGITLTTPFPGLTVEPGDTAGFDVVVDAATVQAVDLTVRNVPEEWTATLKGGGFVVSSVTAGGETPPTVRLDVAVPSEIPDGNFPIQLVGQAASGTVVLPLTVNVQGGSTGTIEMTSDYPGLQGAADATFNFTLTLDNSTPSEVQLELNAEGPPGWQVTARPSGQSQASSITLAAGGTGRVTVAAEPPVNVEAASYDLNVTARGGGFELETPLIVQITGSYAIQVTTTDQRLNAEVQAGAPSQVPLVIVNTGSADLTAVEVTGTVPRDWTVEFAPAVVDTIPAGGTAQVTATITPATNAIAGDYLLTMTASVDQATDSVEIRSTVNPSSVWGLVGIALIALTLGGLAWVFRRFGRR